jgi:hypothetical protein
MMLALWFRNPSRWIDALLLLAMAAAVGLLELILLS